MRALYYNGPQALQFVDIAQPLIGPNDVLLKIKKVGICGTDLHIYHGGMPEIVTPLVLGHEFVGDIVEVGSEVRNVKVGDKAVAEHVIGCGQCEYCKAGRKNLCIKPTVVGLHRPGALAEYVALPAHLVYALPENMTYDQGVLVEPLSVAVYALHVAQVKQGDNLAVIGQGPIGLFLDVIAKQYGAQVYGIDILDSRMNYAKTHGYVDHIINSKTEDVLQRVREYSGRDGVDVAVEAVGMESTAEMALDITRKGGKVVLVGVFEKKAAIDMMKIVKKELTVEGAWTCINSFPTTIELLNSGKINVDDFITHRYNFADALEAFADSATYNESRIKTVIEF